MYPRSLGSPRRSFLAYALIGFVVAYVLLEIALSLSSSLTPSTVINGIHGNQSFYTDDHDDNSDDTICHQIESALNVSSWPQIIYHKDNHPNEVSRNNYYDARKFSSLEEDNNQARETIAAFNQLRNDVLTTELLESSIAPGGMYAARTFASRFLESSSQSSSLLSSPGGRPLLILVFGSSFTIGSNCGESSVQSGTECAWPNRLLHRWQDVLGMNNHSNNSAPIVEWKMFQQNAQNSVNIAQKLPALLDEFRTETNRAPDAILLDNTITDRNLPLNKPWFEAVIRVLVEHFPGTVIVSIVDAQNTLVDPQSVYWKRLYQVKQHYDIAMVDVANMERVLRSNNTNSPDLLWPQASHMISANGTKASGGRIEIEEGPFYWDNFLPKTRKTKNAYYPNNHPPWVTHQYVADAVLYALLRVVQTGLVECGMSTSSGHRSPSPDVLPARSVPKTTVATNEELNGCFICLSPSTRIDAKRTQSIGNATTSVVNSTTPADATATAESINKDVVVTCGDWQWVTDQRNRSGWQSDQYGSIIRFRLKVIDNKPPTISLLHMKSHSTFGSLRITFRAITKAQASSRPPPLWGCNDISKLENETLIPSFLVDGRIEQFSMWDTVTFPSKVENSDINSHHTWTVFNKTVLAAHARARSMDDSLEYVDLYVINPNKHGWRKRIKIQMVTSC